MDWNLQPLVGLGSLLLGMTRDEVGNALNPLAAVTSTNENDDDTLVEFRGMQIPVCAYRSKLLYCIDTHWSIGRIIYEGRDVFSLSNQSLLEMLEERNNNHGLRLGSVIFFLNIGLSACNYFDLKAGYAPSDRGAYDDRGIGVFQLGSFDEMIPHSTPYSSKRVI